MIMTKLSKIGLSRIDKVNLRDVWEHEAYDFTKWLAEENNISILSEEIGIKFENVEVESAAGRYYADIVADVAEGGGKVIIENQLEATNHSHLGQIITYASAFEAKFVLWVVKNFTEEHRQAIDWLNRNISEGINFFLIQVEVYKIDNSRPAPKFNVICEPNNWSKLVKSSASGNKLSATQLLQQKYWEQLIEAANQSEKSLNFGYKARPDSFYDLFFRKGGVHIGLLINTTKRQFGCEFCIDDNKKLFDDLKAKKDEIESALALKGKLDWDRLGDNVKKSRVRLMRHGDLHDKDSWDELNKWCIETSAKFAEVFKKYMEK